MSKRLLGFSVVAVASVLLTATPAHPQVLERPPRSAGGLFGGREAADPNRTRQELTTTVTVLAALEGILDDDTGNQPGVIPRQDVYTGIASGALRYWRGRAARSFEVSGSAFVNTQSHLDVRPLVGGDVGLRGTSTAGPRNNVSLALGGQYQPTFTLGAFGPISGLVESGAVPETDPTAGVTSMDAVALTASVGLQRSWSQQQRTGAEFGFSRQSFVNQEGLDTTNQDFTLSHAWDMRRRGGLRFAYRFADVQMEDVEGTTRPMQSHGVDAGVSWVRRISATRRLGFDAGGGVSYVRTVTGEEAIPTDYLTPSGYASARLDLGRTWSFSMDFRRTSNVLDGLVRQAFTTDAVSIRAGGSLGARLRAAVSGALSHGNGGEGQAGDYQAVTGTAQLNVTLARCCSLLSSYTYYQHDLRDVQTVFELFPTRFRRGVARLGVTVWLPLYRSL